MGSLLYGDVFVMFPVRDWNKYSFHLHYLLAEEIPNCKTPNFEGHRNQTYVVSIIYALDTQTNLKNPYIGNGNDSGTSDTINVRKLLF